MAHQPPRQPPGGSRLPTSTRTSIRSETTTSITSPPRSTASSIRGGSCGSGGTPCASGASSRTGIRPPRAGMGARSAAGPSVLETTSSTIIEPGRTVTTRTERRIGPAPRSATAPQTGLPVPRQRAPTGAAGYGIPQRSVVTQRSTRRGTAESITSTSSMTVDPDGTEIFVEEEQRVIQPAPVAPSPRVGTGAVRRVPELGGRPSIGRPSIGRPSIGRPSIGRPGTQSETTRTSKTTFADGREVHETTSRTERAPGSFRYGQPRKLAPSTPAPVTTASATSTTTAATPKSTIVTSRTSKTNVKGGKKTTTVQEVKKTTQQVLPEGRYAMSLKYPPHTKEGRYDQFSSPTGIRSRMDENMPKAIKTAIMPPEYKGVQDIRKLKAFAPFKDTVSCAMNISRPKSSGPPGYYADSYDSSFLESHIESEPGAYTPPPAPIAADERTILEQEVGETLVRTAMESPGKAVKVTGSRKSPTKPHVIMTDRGPVTATQLVITEKKVEKVPGAEKISRHITGIEKAGCGALQTELDTQQIEPGAGLPKSDTTIETVSIRSAVAIAPGGIKESTTTVIYETTKPPSPSARINISPEQLERLVEEEAIDVNKTLRLKPLDLKVVSPKSYTIRKKEHELKMNYTSVLELQESIIHPEPSPDQEQEEAEPEMLATLMHTEETRIGLEAHPMQMYDMLFPDGKDHVMMTVNSVAPSPLQDILVPNQLPEEFHFSGINPDIETAVATAEIKGESKPAGNAFSEATGQNAQTKNTAKRTLKKLTDVPLLSEEMPPVGVMDMQPIVDLVGAPLRTGLVATASAGVDAEEEEESADQPTPEEESICIDYMLQLEPPTHTSRVQLRGSSRPSWFPGYCIALPELPHLIKVEMTPENALISAWRAVQPNYFPEDSVILV